MYTDRPPPRTGSEFEREFFGFDSIHAYPIFLGQYTLNQQANIPRHQLDRARVNALRIALTWPYQTIYRETLGWGSDQNRTDALAWKLRDRLHANIGSGSTRIFPTLGTTADLLGIDGCILIGGRVLPFDITIKQEHPTFVRRSGIWVITPSVFHSEYSLDIFVANVQKSMRHYAFSLSRWGG